MGQAQRDDDDPELLQRLAGSDPTERIRAGGALHDRFFVQLVRTVLGWQGRFARERARCLAVAQDVAQEAMTRFLEVVAKKPFPADGLGGPYAYLKRIAWRAFLEQETDSARADRRADHVADFENLELQLRASGDASWALSPDPSLPGYEVPSSLLDDLVVQATRAIALTEKDQDLLRLRADETPYDQIGPMLGLSPGYARKRHCEVLKRLGNSIRSLLLGYDPATRSILIRRLGLDDDVGPAA
jgi:DNA-directed RNA polymerase specialized sigma24 family protein